MSKKLLQEDLDWNISLSDPQFDGKSKNSTGVEFFNVATFFLKKIPSSILSFRSQSESLKFYKGAPSQIRLFLDLRHNPVGPEFPKSAINVDISPFSSIFSFLSNY